MTGLRRGITGLQHGWAGLRSGRFRAEHLLRRDTLDLLVQLATVALALLCLFVIALTARDLISTRLSNAKLSNRVESITLIPDGAAGGNEPVGVGDDPRNTTDLDVLGAKSVFGTLVSANPGARATPAAAALKDPMILIGTFVTGGEPPYAIIEDEKRKIQEVFGQGEQLFADGTVKRIFVDRVEIERGGQVEILTLDQNNSADDDSRPSSAGGDFFVIQEAEYTQALENLPLLLTQARAVPYFKDGRAQGLRLFALKAGSFYERLGLKNGDVLKDINGNSLADLSQAMQLLEKLKTERSFTIAVDRNSEAKELRYEIR